MKSGIEILTRLSAAGIKYQLDAGDIVLTPADKVTEEIKATILANRAAVVEAIKGPPWCTESSCIQYEQITLPRRGPTPGCVHKYRDHETWRRIDRMAGCPLVGNA